MYSPRVERCLLDGDLLRLEAEKTLEGEQFDEYVLGAPIGEGSMGCVYRARRGEQPGDYALKVLFRDAVREAPQLELLRREVQAASVLSHPNVAAPIDFITAPNGTSFIVMELAAGQSLESLIRSEAPLAPERAAAIAQAIAAGLEQAHGLGFVHGNLKPANVLVAPGDESGVEGVKIVDFGFARALAVSGAPERVELALYMAPEQAQGGELAPPVDLYALGVMLFEMLSGQPPFLGDDASDLLLKRLSMAPPPLPPSCGLELVADWLLEREAEQRPKTAREVIVAIKGLTFPLAEQERRTDLEDLEDATLPPPSGGPPEDTYPGAAASEEEEEEDDDDGPIPRDRTRVTRTREIRLSDYQAGDLGSSTPVIVDPSIDATQIRAAVPFTTSIEGDVPTRVDVDVKQWVKPRTPVPVLLDEAGPATAIVARAAESSPRLSLPPAESTEPRRFLRKDDEETLGPLRESTSTQVLEPVAREPFHEPRPFALGDEPTTAPPLPDTPPEGATVLQMPSVREPLPSKLGLDARELRFLVAVMLGVALGAMAASLAWKLLGRLL